jgi:fructose/tagatose bisphosphate aldolase
MPLQALATTLAAAERGGYAVGAFNVSDSTRPLLSSHLAWTAALRTELSERPSEVEPSSAIAAAMNGMTGIVRQRMREFRSAGQTQPRP